MSQLDKISKDILRFLEFPLSIRYSATPPVSALIAQSAQVLQCFPEKVGQVTESPN